MLATLAASGIGLGLGRFGATRMRKAVIAAGFPLSLLASGAAGALPAWAWLLPLALLLLLYPRHAWRDAPLFPTPAGALDALALALPLPPGARVLDAGCGLGARAARAAPRLSACPARRRGMELAAGAGRPCRLPAGACAACRPVGRQPWADYDLVYLFQRPESMPRALDKAHARKCAAAPGWRAWNSRLPAGSRDGQLRCPDGRPLWLYRLPLQRARKAASSETVTSR